MQSGKGYVRNAASHHNDGRNNRIFAQCVARAATTARSLLCGDVIDAAISTGESPTCFDPAHLDGQPATSELCLSRGDAFPHLEDQQGGGICYDALLKRKREQEQNRAYLRSLQGPPAHSEPDRFVYNRSGEVMIERGDQIRTPACFRAGRCSEMRVRARRASSARHQRVLARVPRAKAAHRYCMNASLEQ